MTAIETAYAAAKERYGRDSRHTFVADPHVQTTASGRKIVHLQQHYDGIPILGGDLAVRLDGDVAAEVVGDAAEIAPRADSVPDLGAADAVSAALAHFRPRSARSVCLVPHRSLRAAPPTPTVVATFPFPSRPTALHLGRGGTTPSAYLAYWIDGGASHLVWVVRLPFRERAYLLLVAAEGAEKGRVVLCTRWSAGAQCFGTVFSFDHSAGPVRARFPFATNEFPPLLPHPNAAFLGDWVDVDRTAGNNASTFDGNTETLLQAAMAGGILEFPAASPSSKQQTLLNAFFYCNLLHDFFLLLGFGEAEGNFQLKNFSAAKGGNDRLQVRIFDNKNPHLADMDANDDGKPAKLSLGRAPSGEPSGLHAELVTHEYTHGVVHRMIGGRLGTLALIQQQSQAMDEGWADYFAITLRNHYLGASPKYDFAEWAGNPPPRSASYAPSVARDFANLGKKPNNTVNGAGEIFAAALIRFNERLGDKIANAARGHCIGWRAVVESLRLIKSNPNFLDGRDALLAGIGEIAKAALITATEAAQAQAAAREAFALYGMGRNAKSPSPAFGGTTSDFTA